MVQLCTKELKKIFDSYFRTNIHQHGEIVIDISIDSIPLSKSFEKHFWPVLGKFRKLKYPFIIAVYLGSGKPKDINEYLKEFVTKVANLKENKIQWSSGIKHNFRIDNFVLKPARLLNNAFHVMVTVHVKNV